ncbi:MAG: hypothetical protein V4534_02995 [Myxococcota bacterium]
MFLLKAILALALMAPSPKQEINILLLGKSGAGKSSLINIFYNHLRGRSYGDELDIVIPLKHKGRDTPVTVEMYKKYEVFLNEDGQSQTEEVLRYTVTTKDLVVNFWDTPGLPDTRGPQKDEEHLTKIKNILANVSFNAIAVVFPPEGIGLQSQEFISTMSSIVDTLPKSYSGNIIGIVNRTIGENIDEDTQADYRSKLSAAFGITDSKRLLPGYYFDGSSFFNKTPKGYENWAADDRIIAQILDRVRTNKVTETRDAVELQSLPSLLEAEMKKLSDCIADGNPIHQKFQDAWNNLSHERKIEYSSFSGILVGFLESLLTGSRYEFLDFINSQIFRNLIMQENRQQSILDEIVFLRKKRGSMAMPTSPDPISKIIEDKLLEIGLSRLSEEDKSRSAEPYQYLKRPSEQTRNKANRL